MHVRYLAGYLETDKWTLISPALVGLIVGTRREREIFSMQTSAGLKCKIWRTLEYALFGLVQTQFFDSSAFALITSNIPAYLLKQGDEVRIVLDYHYDTKEEQTRYTVVWTSQPKLQWTWIMRIGFDGIQEGQPPDFQERCTLHSRNGVLRLVFWSQPY